MGSSIERGFRLGSAIFLLWVISNLSSNAQETAEGGELLSLLPQNSNVALY